MGVSWELLDAPSHVQVVEEDLLGAYKSWKETSYGAILGSVGVLLGPPGVFLGPRGVHLGPLWVLL